MKTLYIECNMGVAGDMLMGALYELCDQKEKFLSDMNQAFAPYGVTLSVEPAVKCGISGTHMRGQSITSRCRRCSTSRREIPYP